VLHGKSEKSPGTPGPAPAIVSNQSTNPAQSWTRSGTAPQSPSSGPPDPRSAPAADASRSPSGEARPPRSSPFAEDSLARWRPIRESQAPADAAHPVES